MLRTDLEPLDCKLLPQTYPWPRRGLSWVLWRCPVLRLLTRPVLSLLGRKSPWGRVVVVCRVRPDSSGRKCFLADPPDV